MFRKTLVTLSASALLSAAVATKAALAFPFGPPPGPPAALGGPPPGLGGPPAGLAGPRPGFAGPPHAGLGGMAPRLGSSAGHSAGIPRLGGSGGYGYGQSTRAGYNSGYGHSRSRYGRWARGGLYGYAGSGYGYDSESYSSSSDDCSYVYGYRSGAYRRVCSDN
jgi:hypothetical protein